MWIKLHSGEFRDGSSLSNRVSLTQSRIIEYTGNTARTEGNTKTKQLLLGNCGRRKFDKFSETVSLGYFDRDMGGLVKGMKRIKTGSQKDIVHLDDMALQIDVIHLHFHLLNLFAHNLQHTPIDNRKQKFSVSPRIPQMRPDVPFHS